MVRNTDTQSQPARLFLIQLPEADFVEQRAGALPGLYDCALPKLAVRTATTAAGAVSKYVHGTFGSGEKKRIQANTILARLRDSVGLNVCAFEVPEDPIPEQGRLSENDAYWGKVADLADSLREQRPDIENPNYMAGRLMAALTRDRAVRR
jgi:hypothetical protein